MMRRAWMLIAFSAGCSGVPGEVTYYEHVKPLMEDHCIRCHQPAGVGVGDFSEPDNVVSFADRIAARVEEGTMPLPVADPECRDFVGSEHMTLDKRERAIVSRWVEQGAPLGDAALAASGSYAPASLDDADMKLRIPPYSPSFSDERNPGNEYRCFVLDPEHTEDFFVTALHPLVDQEALVHHIVVGAVDRDEVHPDAASPGGVNCIDDDMGVVENMLAAWAPGSQPQVFEGGAGMRVRADQVLVVQMHYYLSSPEAAELIDESGYALKTAPSVSTELEVLPLGSFAFRIPADDPAYLFEDVWRPERDLRVHGVFPHMHVLGSAYRMEVEGQKDGCMVESTQYDFDNQLTYLFAEPMEIAQGEQIRWQCTWNNSTSNPDRIFEQPQETFYGERTDEEMCFFFTIVEKE